VGGIGLRIWGHRVLRKRNLAAPPRACQIEASTNLSNWDAIFITNLPAAAPFQFRYGDANSPPLRFYRLSQTPGF
jgi:hypothetical protein